MPRMKFLLYFFVSVALLPGESLSQSLLSTVVYKTIDSTSLTLNFYYPENLDESKAYPAMVFFFGGGWVEGNPEHLAPQAKYFAKRGVVGICADYRTYSRFETTPFESLMDAKSAIRFIRKNAERFHIDPDKLIGCGGSAGGQLAAACALVDGYNQPGENTSVSTIPDALVLFNPVIDNGPGGYGYDKIGGKYKCFSPLHNIRAGAPPTIIFLGTADNLIPVETAKYYKMVMEKVGSRCDLFLYPGEKHGFFNKGKPHFDVTLEETAKFLKELGYLDF